MKRLLLFALLALCGASGCQGLYGPRSHWGCRFEVYKPGFIESPNNVTPVTNNSSSGLVGIDHATGMTVPVEASATLGSRFAGRARSSSVGAALGGPGDCTLADVCERIDRLERRLPPPPPAQRMPPGQPE